MRALKGRLAGIVRLTAAGVLAAAALGSPATAPAALAHPLGNFSVNRYAKIELGSGAAQIHYVLDMAEIPTFLELSLVDTDQDGTLSDLEKQQYGVDKAERIRAGLAFTVDGQPVRLAMGPTRTTTLTGQGGLETLRFEALFTATPSSSAWNAVFVDNNEPNRPGWREIVVTAGQGASIGRSTAPQADVSAALTKYPNPDTQTPLDVREAQFSVTFAAVSGAALFTLPALDPSSVERGVGALPIPVPLATEMTLPATLFALAAAVVLGAVHALSPGHGKSVVAAYLVGSRGTVRQAVFLGMTITATHTAGVYALGFITLAASAWVLPHQLYPVLGLASGVMVLLVGLALLRSRLAAALGLGERHGHSHAAGHSHEHEHEHEYEADHGLAAAGRHSHDGGHVHSHLPLAPDGSVLGTHGLLALGVSGGLVPCPSALVVMLSAIALHQTGLGLALILAFSLGLAGVITGMGVVLVLSRDRVSRLRVALPDRLTQPLLRGVPVAAALVVVAVGVLMTVRGVAEL